MTPEPDSQPSTPPSDDDLEAVDDLAGLAVELTSRGYTTRLTTTPAPHLTLQHPQISGPRDIHTAGALFTWGEQPFSQRPPALISQAADAIDLMTQLASTRQQGEQ